MAHFLEEQLGLPLAEIREIVDFSGKILFAALGLAYVAGLLIVNLYLRKYDLVSFGLVRAEYAMAGLLWLALLSMGYGFMAMCQWAWRWLRDAFQDRAWFRLGWRLIATLFLIAAFVTWPIEFLSGRVDMLDSWRMWVVAGVVLMMPVPFPMFFRTLKHGWNAWSARVKGDTSKHVPVDDILINAIQVLSGIALYATFAYPVFQPVYGGGKPTVVRVVTSAEAGVVLIAAGFQVETKGTRVALVAETAEWIVLAPPEAADPVSFKSRPTVRLRQEDVRAVVSLEEAATKSAAPKKSKPTLTPGTKVPTRSASPSSG
jgi:hypothetical protein